MSVPLTCFEIDGRDLGPSATLTAQFHQVEQLPRHSVIERDFKADGRRPSGDDRLRLVVAIAHADKQVEFQQTRRLYATYDQIGSFHDGLFLGAGASRENVALTTAIGMNGPHVQLPPPQSLTENAY